MMRYKVKGNQNLNLRGRSAFTLMEVLLVLAILVVLAGFAVVGITGAQEGANVDATKTQVGLMKNSIRMYKFNLKNYPASLEDLLQAPSDDQKNRWRGPYLEEVKSIPLDAWDNGYQYSAPGKNNPNTYDLWSSGPDGQSGTDDDIGNWEV